jgi:hypothetical protein
VASLVGQTFAARIEPNYAVFVHSDRAPTAADWNQALQVLRSEAAQRASPILVYTDGGAPDALQRAELLKVFGPIRPRVAVLTKSVIARVAAKAISLLVTELRVFDTNQLDAALTHLRLNETDRVSAARVLYSLRQELAIGSGSQRPRQGE